MGADKLILGQRLLLAFTRTKSHTRDGLVDFTKFANIFQIFIHFLVRDHGQRQVVGKAAVFILLQNLLCKLIEVDGEPVVRLLSGDIEDVAGDVGSFEFGNVGVPQGSEGTEAEHVACFGQGTGIVDHLFIFVAIIFVELYLRAVGGNFVVVEFEQLFFRQEDDRAIDQLELRLHLTDLFIRSVALAHGPLEKPAKVEVVLLDGVLLHLSVVAEMLDEGVDTIVVEEVEGAGLDNGFHVFLEGVPDLQGSGGPLVGCTLVVEEFREVAGHRRTLGRFRLGLLCFVFRVGVRVVAADDLAQLLDGGSAFAGILEFEDDGFDATQEFVDLGGGLFL